MDGATIELLLVGLIGFILIIAVASTADEAKKIRKILTEINQKLDNGNSASNNTQVPNAFNSYSQANNSSNGGTWNCKCGSRVYNSDVCRNCGAHRDQQ